MDLQFLIPRHMLLKAYTRPPLTDERVYSVRYFYPAENIDFHQIHEKCERNTRLQLVKNTLNLIAEFAITIEHIILTCLSLLKS